MGDAASLLVEEQLAALSERRLTDPSAKDAIF
jgi:hypothetical protein